MHWSVPFQTLEVLIEQRGQPCEAKGRLLSHSLPSMPLCQGEGLNWLGSPASSPVAKVDVGAPHWTVSPHGVLT